MPFDHLFPNRSHVNHPSPAPMPPWLDGLNAPQREPVLTTEGSVLLLAGAGTGKTAALTARMAQILYTRLAWPSEILAVTFTNKAAREMRERIGAMVGSAVEGMPWLGTFHSIGAKLLRRHAEIIGLQSNFTIIDTDDQIRLLKQLIQSEDLDEKRFPARGLAALLDKWKNAGKSPADLDAADNEAFANGKGQRMYALYQARLLALNACDFGDLLLHGLNLLKNNRDILEKYQAQFKYILVDEYQDTNAVQYLWLRLLAQKRKNICCVGDDDQSIYSWRGAEVANILRFEKDFPGAKTIKLEQNYRSTPHILAAASGLIDANSARLGKTLWTELDDGEKVRIIGVWDGPEEARRVGEEIEALQYKGESLDSVAILVRAQHQTREFEDRFIQIGVNYRIVGGFRFYERAEIRDAIAYLRIVNQPADDLAFERIVNVPKRGIGDKAVEKIHIVALAERAPLSVAAARLVGTDELTGKARKSLADLVVDTTELNVHQLRKRVLDEVQGHARSSISILFESFAYKRGVPPDADFVFDTRCLPNPHWVPELRPLSGKDAAVKAYFEADPQVGIYLQQIIAFIDTWLPRFEAETRSYLTVAFGCTGGNHRSVYLAESLARHCSAGGHDKVMVYHRELE